MHEFDYSIPMSDLDKYKHSSALYTDPSFAKGVARSVDLFAQLNQYNEQKTDDMADQSAVQRDWYMIGQDLARAIKQYGRSKTNGATTRK